MRAVRQLPTFFLLRIFMLLHLGSMDTYGESLWTFDTLPVHSEYYSVVPIILLGGYRLVRRGCYREHGFGVL